MSREGARHKYPVIGDREHLHVTIDKDQYEFLAKLVEKRRSTFSQVIREILQEVMKEENR